MSAAVPLRPAPLWRRYAAGLLPPLVLVGLLLAVLVYALESRLSAEAEYDSAAVREWISEARVYRHTLPELVKELANSAEPAAWAVGGPLHQHLAALAEAPRLYQGLLPLFPVVYRLEVRWQPSIFPPVVWDARLPSRSGQVERHELPLWGNEHAQAVLVMDCQLHAFAQRQEIMAARAARLRTWLSLLAVVAGVVALGWVALFLRAERRRELQRLEDLQRIDASQREALKAQLARQQLERERDEKERQLLAQQLARQHAERQALELKSRLYANMGVMAGSYAHNIKNMMVRPADLLTRCANDPALPPHLAGVLAEVRDSMQAVTDRTQQILRTVRSDPTRTQRTRCELNEILTELVRTWNDLAREKWHLDLHWQPASTPLWIDADRSQVLQLFENLLFNARDATFEQRSALRQAARQASDPRAALLAASAWRGQVTLTARREGDHILASIQDNGIGMTPEVRQRCTEAHFTTKRDNALYEGITTGLGLGLAFVAAILESHGGRMHIDTAPGAGTTFTVELPAAPPPSP